ncbi:hydroquinone glucosyltransferase-like [Tasmannia lanceolata]|uniref:hydroquinone glucosyltransferase-like n=1 Tax=Tasmannia lanceolata TaxID=3420 RepID=UPI004063F847
MEESQKPHIAIIQSPGMGHLIPLAELAKRLVLHNFSITLVSLSADPSSKAQNTILESLPKDVNSISLPPISPQDTPTGIRAETRMCLTVSLSLPSIREILKTLNSTTHLVAVIVDLFCTDVIDLAGEFSVRPYLFFSTTAMCLSLALNLETLDATYTCEYRDITEPLKLPGCIPVSWKDVGEPFQDRQNDAYRWVLHQSKRYKDVEGILVNSFVDFEPGAIKALTEEMPGRPPIYPVGPLIGLTRESDESECLKWLDDQPRGSVLFVCYGSGGTLSFEQLNELALGLELSEQRFLWVVRSPSEKEANATFFSLWGVKGDPFEFLPEGFVSRIKGKGMLVSSWAPQTQVLSHGSTGGFLSHCGWNSTLESVVNGVPLIAWPLYAEQKMNAVMVEGMKVALRPKASETGLIKKEEIARVVKGLMKGEEGKEARSRMGDLKDAAAKALAEDGSSYRSLSEVAQQWKLQEN